MRFLYVVLLCLFVSVVALTSTAYAEDDNVVNPRQLPDSSFIYDMSIIDISKADSYYDGQTVQVVGEVVGDNIAADFTEEYRWIMLLSQDAKSNATVSVYMNAKDVERIGSFGKYGVQGTMLRVNGEYHLTCSQHEGISDIHATQVSVVSQGKETPDTFEIEPFLPGIVLIVVGLLLIAAFAWLQEKRR